MATILTKKKDTTGAPSAGDLTNSTGGAELAVNTADKRLYTKDSGGNVVEVGTNPSTLTVPANQLNSITVGQGAGSVSTNTAVGASALAANTTGANNVAVGYQALDANTTGVQNTAVGSASLGANTTGTSNTAVGHNSLTTNTTGVSNVALGQAALFSNTTASGNTALGREAMYSNTTGASNTAVGFNALFANTTGADNTAVGYVALDANTTGLRNSAFGAGALGANTTGLENTALGVSALAVNTTGVKSTAVGYAALQSCTTGLENTAVGWNALGSLTTGQYNTALSQNAGAAVTTQKGNTYIGLNSGLNSTGSHNTFVGSLSAVNVGCGQNMTTGSKNTIIGSYNGNQGGLDIRTSSNRIVLSDGDGNPTLFTSSANNFYVNSNSANPTFILSESTSPKWYYYNDTANSNTLKITSNFSTGVSLTTAATSWSSFSDLRLKTITSEISNAVQSVNSLRAVKYTFDNDKNATPRVGLIAQEVQVVLPEAVDVIDDKGHLGVRYTEVVPLLVSAIKELSAQVTALQAEVNTLKGN